MNATLASPAAHFSPRLALPLPASPANTTRPLWAAVGVLSICVLAMGATLVHVNKRVEPIAAAALPLAGAALPLVGAMALTTPAGHGMITEDKLIEKPPLAGIKSAQSAPKTGVSSGLPSVAKSTAKAPASTAPVVVAQAPTSATPAPDNAAGYPPVVSPAPAASPVLVTQAPAKPMCASCGTVQSVTPITREAPGSGVGVIAGGVLGGVVGNQMGKGNGRAATTILGAIGGGWAGNAIEKNMKKTTAYSVRVRMEDGSTRTIEQSSSPMVGSKVTLDGNTIRPA